MAGKTSPGPTCARPGRAAQAAPGRPARRKDFITMADATEAELLAWLKLAARLKKERKAGKPCRILEGKTLAMIFQKPSTRTRVSFEMAMRGLGGQGMNLSAGELQLGRGETVADTARVLSRYVDGIMARVYAHADIEALARNATVPVINGLSDFSHPCQAFSDYMTILERKGRLKGVTMAYVGDGNNVAHSLLFGGAKLGVSVVCVCPRGFEPAAEVLRLAGAEAMRSGSMVAVTDSLDGVKGADVVYTDVWTSMGQEAEREKRLKVFRPYQVNAALMALAGKLDSIFMHCLPAHRGEEVTDEVMDGPSSVVFDQAENRMHGQMAILASLMG